MRNLRSAGRQESTRLRGVLGTRRDGDSLGQGLGRDRHPGDTGDRSGGRVADPSPHRPGTALLFKNRKCPQFHVNL